MTINFEFNSEKGSSYRMARLREFFCQRTYTDKLEESEILTLLIHD